MEEGGWREGRENELAVFFGFLSGGGATGRKRKKGFAFPSFPFFSVPAFHSSSIFGFHFSLRPTPTTRVVSRFSLLFLSTKEKHHLLFLPLSKTKE